VIEHAREHDEVERITNDGWCQASDIGQRDTAEIVDVDPERSGDDVDLGAPVIAVAGEDAMSAAARQENACQAVHRADIKTRRPLDRASLQYLPRQRDIRKLEAGGIDARSQFDRVIPRCIKHEVVGREVRVIVH
jgi:hypothetical protein